MIKIGTKIPANLEPIGTQFTPNPGQNKPIPKPILSLQLSTTIPSDGPTERRLANNLRSRNRYSNDLYSVQICGDGVAAHCCAHILRKFGFKVAIDLKDRARVPAIMLGEQALLLMRDVFEKPSLFSDYSPIRNRVVSWGVSRTNLLHSAVVISEQSLLENLGCDLDAQPIVNPDFTIFTSTPIPATVTQHNFGSRRATASPVTLVNPSDLSTCWIESLQSGWLFLIPNPRGLTWLLGIGDQVESLLSESKLISPLVRLTDSPSVGFSSCPRIITPLTGQDWLACGSVAMGFDPICGDGTAQAIREAILASATIHAIFNGGAKTSLLSHYEMMLTASMRRHLALSADFYRSGGSSGWWQQELAALIQGHTWCTDRLARAPEPQYQLQGFELVRREAVSH